MFRSLCNPSKNVLKSLLYTPKLVKINMAKRACSSVSALQFDDNLVRHLDSLKRRYVVVEDTLAKGDISVKDIAKLGKELSELGRVTSLTDDRNEKLKTIVDLKSVEKEEEAKGADGEEMLILVQEERMECETALAEIEQEIIKIMTPKDEADERGCILEVRAGTGGDEASLFASEIFKMYQKYASLMSWKWEEMSLSRSEIGGFKEAQALISGDNVFKHLKYEAGVHRVQRVPSNDTKIQTSAISVIIMPEAEDVDVELRPQDLKIDVMRSQGAGGQGVNKTESAVRITHLPTGLTISMQDERSQIQNRARAMKYLKAKVYEMERQKSVAQRSELRSLSNGTGDRTDKIRTYNFPQDRVTDHRISQTVNGVERVLSGEALSMLTDALGEYDEKEKLVRFIEKISRRD